MLVRSPQKTTRPTVRSKTHFLRERKVCFVTWYTSSYTLINVELQIHPQTIKSRFYETLQFTESLRNLLQLIRLSIHIKNSTIKRSQFCCRTSWIQNLLQFNVAQSRLGVFQPTRSIISSKLALERARETAAPPKKPRRVHFLSLK